MWNRSTLLYMASLKNKGKYWFVGQKFTTGLRHLLPGVRLEKSFRALKAWAYERPVYHHVCMSDRVNLILVSAAMRR